MKIPLIFQQRASSGFVEIRPKASGCWSSFLLRICCFPGRDSTRKPVGHRRVKQKILRIPHRSRLVRRPSCCSSSGNRSRLLEKRPNASECWSCFSLRIFFSLVGLLHKIGCPSVRPFDGLTRCVHLSTSLTYQKVQLKRTNADVFLNVFYP